MFTIIMKFLLKTIAVLAIIVLVVVLVLPEAVYRYGLTFAPDNRAATSKGYNKRLHHVQWVASDEEDRMIPLTLYDTGNPVSRFMALSRLAYQGAVNGRNKAPRAGKLTAGSAYTLLKRDGGPNVKKMKKLGWKAPVIQIAAMMWVNHDWSIGKQLDTLLAEARYVPGCEGIDIVSRHIFEKEANDLTLEEAALLVSNQANPFRGHYGVSSRWSVSSANKLIEKVSAMYPELYGKAKPYTELPFGDSEIEAVKKACE